MVATYTAVIQQACNRGVVVIADIQSELSGPTEPNLFLHLMVLL